MAYVPLNLNVYTAAFAGALAGAGVPTGAFIVDPVSGDYAPVANVAAVFAQAVDTAWGAVEANQYDVDAIEEICTNILTKGSGAPMSGAVTTQGNWTIVATAIVALVRAGDTKATADGVTFPPIANNGKINELLFLDPVNGLIAGADGSLGRPFLAIGIALAYAVAQGWSEVQLQLAPGTYPDNYTVPNTLSYVIISGWSANESTQLTLIGGDAVVEPGARVAYQNCQITGATISSPIIGVDSLFLSFENCLVSSDILSFAAGLEYRQSAQAGDILSTGLINIQWDGWSWGRTLQITPAIPAGAVRQFLDAGHSVYNTSLASNAVPVLTYAFGTLAIPADYLLAGDHAKIQVATPATQDFVCGVHGVSPDGTVVYWLYNISRNGGGGTGDFADNVQVLIHHENMVDIPAP